MNSLFLQGDNLKSGGMRLQKFVCIVCCLALCACGPQKKKSMEETEVLIETSMGDIKVRLYDDTPKHRDNFIKLARAGAYDNIVFHRIVRGFMIQTGDPRLKAAGVPLAVDTAAYNYTLPAEILYPRHFHKKGALAAARMGDDVNPGKESSGTQFYIVTGKTYTPGTLMELYSAIYQERVDERCEELSRGHLKEMYLMRRKGLIPYVSLPNILAQRPVVPEFLQYYCKPDMIAASLIDQLSDRRRSQLTDLFTRMHESLLRPTAELACEAIERVLRGR